MNVAAGGRSILERTQPYEPVLSSSVTVRSGAASDRDFDLPALARHAMGLAHGGGPPDALWRCFLFRDRGDGAGELLLDCAAYARVAKTARLATDVGLHPAALFELRR